MHQDYILRMIQQMGLFVTGILQRRKDGDDGQALVEIEEAYGRMTGLHASLVHGLSEDDLVSMMTAQGSIHPERFVAMAILLHEEGDIYSDHEDIAQALPRMQKALRLYLEAWERSDALRHETIPGLDQTITWMAGYPVTPDTRLLLLDYLEEKGRFDEAENLILDWIEGESDEAFDYAEAFYQRLLELSDAELIVGGLTRDEVRAGLEALG
jgi:tetratricopeptide (TPR) repeat protein